MRVYHILFSSLLCVLILSYPAYKVVASAQPATTNEMAKQPALLPATPLDQYPLLYHILSGMPKPSVVHQNQTTALVVTVNDKENITLYNVQLADFGPSDYFKLDNLSKIDVLEPYATKIIYGNITAAYNVTGAPRTGEAELSWRTIADNNAGMRMETCNSIGQ